MVASDDDATGRQWEAPQLDLTQRLLQEDEDERAGFQIHVQNNIRENNTKNLKQRWETKR